MNRASSQAPIPPSPGLAPRAGILFSLLLVLAGLGRGPAARAAELPLEEQLREGGRIAAELRSSPPGEEINFKGRLSIREGVNKIREVPFHFRGLVTPTNWLTIYRAEPAPSSTNAPSLLAVMHQKDSANSYWSAPLSDPSAWEPLPPPAAAQPFAASDFTLQDLGLEFLHWPQQRALKIEMRKGRPCHVLESSPGTPASLTPYRRVVSWIDTESGGLLLAEAYDVSNKLLKEFSINSMKKVQGRWQVQQMEIRNVQTRSRTRLDFDLQ
ncbi:MAG TPA: hypothetical protein DCM86_06065 [Verrucomicrobiales bacterium]|nr:hypothetical protein [Verrucomicrobiales bacterium]